jgi:hypothetical protein
MFFTPTHPLTHTTHYDKDKHMVFPTSLITPFFFLFIINYWVAVSIDFFVVIVFLCFSIRFASECGGGGVGEWGGSGEGGRKRCGVRACALD